MSDALRIAAPAKINLRLRVLAREESGFHALETVFCALSLADEVEARPGTSGIRLAVEGSVETGPPERNLAVRAARAFYGRTGDRPAIDLRLLKRIPSAAGLGGGSSDAAAVLRVLNALHGEPIGPDELLGLAAALGSDVPFFLCGSPLALGWSRGERLLALPPLPAAPVLVAHPGVAMPTPEVFRRFAAGREGGYQAQGATLDAGALASWERIAGLAVNDLEPAVIEQVPLAREALGAMRRSGALVALMAGSGASVFGVFAGAEDRDRAAEAVKAAGLRCWCGETLRTMPLPRVDRPVEAG